MLVPQEGEVGQGGRGFGQGRGCWVVGWGEWVTCKRRVKKLRERRLGKESRFSRERGGERGIEEKKKGRINSDRISLRGGRETDRQSDRLTEL